MRKKQCCEKHNAVSKQFTKNYSAKSAVRLPDTKVLTHTNTVEAVYCKLLCKNNSPLTDPDDSRARRFSSVRPATLKHAHLQTMWPEYTVLRRKLKQLWERWHAVFPKL